MGKKSLIKSTSKKKKAATRKKDVDKKSKSSEELTAAQTDASQKTPAKKKSAAQKKGSEKMLNLKDLIFKKFEIEIPDKLFKVKPEKRTYSAPPIISTSDKKEAARIKALLFRKFDLSPLPEKRRETKVEEKPDVEKVAEKKKVEKPLEKKKPSKADYKEIIARRFFQSPSPEALAKSPHQQVIKKREDYTAPPLIAATDKKEVERLKSLLFRKMDLTTFPEKVKKVEEPEKLVAEKEIPKKAVEEKTVEKPVEQKEPKKADYKEIMARIFHEPPQADMLIARTEPDDKRKKEYYTAPPLISTDDENEAARIKKLLFRQFEIPPSPAQPAVTIFDETLISGTEEEPVKDIEEKISEVTESVTVSETPEIQPEELQDQQIDSESDKSEKEITEKEDKGPKVTVSYDEPPPTDTEVSDPMDKMIKLVAAGVALIFLIIIGSSFSNQSKYYIVPVKDGIQVLKGRFAPMGEEVLARLDGVAPPEIIKDVYESHEVLPMLFSYFLDKADALLNANAVPDLKAMKKKLDRALTFASTKEDRAAVNSRINLMEKLVLQYRANLAASRGTPEDLALAIGILSNVLKLEIDSQQKSLIQSRIEYLQEYRNELLANEDAKASEQAEQEKAASEKEGAGVEAEETQESEGTGH